MYLPLDYHFTPLAMTLVWIGLGMILAAIAVTIISIVLLLSATKPAHRRDTQQRTEFVLALVTVLIIGGFTIFGIGVVAYPEGFAMNWWLALFCFALAAYAILRAGPGAFAAIMSKRRH